MIRPPEHAVTIEGEVPFHHVDLLKVVWHGHYFVYLETARTALLRSVDLDNDELERLGYHSVVVDSQIRHVAPLRYGDQFCCSAWFTQVDFSIRISYFLWNKRTGKRVAKAKMILAILNKSGELLLGTPDAIRTRLPF
jgi:acyl-CoA thioester hydrolase